MERQFNILIVDDDVALSSNLQDVLEGEGYGAVAVYDGQAALSLCRDKVFDLALIDIKLPGITGVKLIEALATLSPGTEYIIITGYASLETAIEAVKQKNIAAYETKPFNMNRLLPLVRQIAERRRVEEALRASEKKFSTSVETLLDGFAIFSAIRDETGHIVDFRYDYINEAGCRLNHRSYEEQIGHTLLELLPKHKDIGLFDEYVRLVETGQPLVRESILYEDVFGGGQRLARAFDFRAVKLGDGFAVDWRDITERKRAEEALLESEKKYRSLFENMLSGFAYCKILVDENNQPIDFVYLEVNDAFERLTGLKREDVVGRKVTEAIPGTKESHPELLSIYGKVALTGEATKFDIYFEPLGIWLSIAVYSPQKGYFVAIFENITERKRAEEELKKSEERYKSLVNNVKLGIFRSTPGPTGAFLEVNPAMKEITGYSRKELLQMSVSELYVRPEAREAVLKDVASALGKVAKELHIRKKDGTSIVVSDTKVAVRDSAGKILYFDGILEDITERKQAEEELKIKAQLLGMANDSICLHDLDGKIIYVNEASYQSRGYTRDELTKLNFWTLISPEYTKLIEPRIKELMKKGKVAFESADIRKDKSIMPVEVHARTIDLGGKKLILSVRRDISERKQTEEELASAQAQAIQTDKLAALGRLAANVAHEINNPMTAILMASSFALEEIGEASPYKSELETINGEALRVRDIVKNLLDFARPSQGEIEEVDISSVVQNAMVLLGRQIEHQHIELKVDCTSQVLKVLVDKNQITQVCHNLLTNALDAMPQGGCLTISTRREKGYAVVRFTDTGAGIPPENLSRIFEPFFTTKRAAKGTGLGLSICHNIIDKYGGKIEVKSKVGKGSTFAVRLPLAANREGE